MKQKIVILGGGAGSLAAAWALTDVRGWEKRYEVTVYQLGWRLGGKGHTGRNQDYANRIEEHGIHLWSGFYQNAFLMIRKCYAELVARGLRKPNDPLATWRQAFAPHNVTSFGQRHHEDWIPWGISLESPGREHDLPGDGGPLPSPFQMILELVPLFTRYLETAHDWSQQRPVLRGVGSLLDRVQKLLELLPINPSKQSTLLLRASLRILQSVAVSLRRELPRAVEEDPHLARLLIFLNLGVTWIVGMIDDGVIFDGFDAIDDQDYGQWLKKHGAMPETLEVSGLVRAAYDYLFSYEEGDYQQPNLAAGVGLRIQLRLILASGGAPWWRMLAGFGDTIFAPLYLVLRDRGVRFEFFHRADRLDISPDGRRIQAIHLTRQIDLKANAPTLDLPRSLPAAEYEPLVMVKGLPCWPSEPLYDQIVQGEDLKRRRIDLESAWTDWQGAEKVVLEAGDFDRVVLGVSLEPLKQLARGWLDDPRHSAWKTMFERVKTAQILALQLWLRPTLEELGCLEKHPALAAYAPPLSSYVDMTEVLEREEWTEQAAKEPTIAMPGSLAYFCGMFRDAAQIPPPYQPDPDFPAREHARAKRWVRTWIDDHLPTLWPAAGQPGKFDLDLLGVAARPGQDRLDSQFWTPNVDPAQRYVLSLAGTTKSRLEADGTGFDNATLAGDIVRNGLSCGCVEAAVMGGLQAARAICGHPERIWGETDFQRWRYFSDDNRRIAVPDDFDDFDDFDDQNPFVNTCLRP